MKRLRLIACGFALLGIIITTAIAQEPTPPPLPMGPAPLPFEGKIIVVYTKTGGAMAPQCLSGWGKARIGDQEFLFGTSEAFYDGMPAAGRKTWIAISDTYQIVEYDDVDEFKKDVAKAWQLMRAWGRGGGGERNDRGGQRRDGAGNQKGGEIF